MDHQALTPRVKIGSQGRTWTYMRLAPAELTARCFTIKLPGNEIGRVNRTWTCRVIMTHRPKRRPLPNYGLLLEKIVVLLFTYIKGKSRKIFKLACQVGFEPTVRLARRFWRPLSYQIDFWHIKWWHYLDSNQELLHYQWSTLNSWVIMPKIKWGQISDSNRWCLYSFLPRRCIQPLC